MVKETLGYLVGRRWWWVTLLVLAAIAVMIRLSIWQVDRLQQRRAANELLRQQLSAAPLSLNDVDLQMIDLTTMPDRRVRALGIFDFSEQVLLKVQNYRGSAGAHLVAPLRLRGREEAVLVDRGWIPEAESDPEAWSQFDETGVVTVEGVIQLTETAHNVDPPETPQKEWFRINVGAIERQMPYELFPVYVLQSSPDGGNQRLPYREARDIDLSEGPHLSYALQWAIFSVMLGIGYVAFVRRQERDDERQHTSSSPK
jgi:surfeit locus 1 family protein